MCGAAIASPLRTELLQSALNRIQLQQLTLYIGLGVLSNHSPWLNSQPGSRVDNRLYARPKAAELHVDSLLSTLTSASLFGAVPSLPFPTAMSMVMTHSNFQAMQALGQQLSTAPGNQPAYQPSSLCHRLCRSSMPACQRPFRPNISLRQ